MCLLSMQIFNNLQQGVPYFDCRMQHLIVSVAWQEASLLFLGYTNLRKSVQVCVKRKDL